MAARSLNRVVLLGNLTRDPELKYIPNGTAVCTFGIATNRTWTTATGETKESAQFHRIVAWQKLAELCGKLLTKGRKVYVEGRLTYRTYVGKDGIQRSITEIVADDFIIYDDKYRREASDEDSSMPDREDSIASEPATTESTTLDDISIETDDETPAPESKKTKTEEKPEVKQDSDESVDPDDIPF